MARVILLFTLLLFLGCRPEFIPHTPEQRIAESRDAIVRLFTQSRSCSGFYISEYEILTAAHCVHSDEITFAETSDGTKFIVEPIYVDEARDLAVFTSDFSSDNTLQIWNPTIWGAPQHGSQIISMGFPGYFFTNFMFEISHLKDTVRKDEIEYLISDNISYLGESGGPVISLKNGLVIGVVHAVVERVSDVGPDLQQHKSLSLLISWKEILEFLKASQARS